MDDLQRQLDECMLNMQELIDFLRIDPVFLSELIHEDETKSSYPRNGK